MSATKKRSKPYRAKPLGDNIKLKMQPWKVKAVFDPLLAILDQLEQDGTIDTTTRGQAVFRDHNDGVWYDSPVAIMGVVDAYEIHERRTGRLLGLEPLRQLANKLRYAAPVFSADTLAARACLTRMRAETIEMTAGYARDLIKDFQIMEELQKIAA
ncbi:hypothetical protein [Collimonas humicola]|uniref:hypothetical protein n=1 Tax=Collimonas humicola TaxID=2825886 RepID=UPI001B8AFA4C|nr:hypothetical protein [Collimonas humicola]